MARRLIPGAAMLLIGAIGLACGDAAPTICRRPATDEPIPYVEGTTENGVYMTSPWNGPLLHFPGGAYYAIRHGLGEIPRWWQCWVSFEPDGVDSGSLALAAGNEVEVKAIDDQTLTVLNGTCVEFWLVCAVGGSATTP